MNGYPNVLSRSLDAIFPVKAQYNDHENEHPKMFSSENSIWGNTSMSVLIHLLTVLGSVLIATTILALASKRQFKSSKFMLGGNHICKYLLGD